MKCWHLVGILLIVSVGTLVVFLYPPVVERISNSIPITGPAPISLIFVGDTMLARSVGDTMAAKNDWTWPFERIASITSAADLTFGNLETTISTRGAPSGCGYCFRADPRVIEGLRYAGFDALSIANNHTHDYGSDAYTDTQVALTAGGIRAVSGEPVIFTVHGTRITFLAYTEPLNQERVTAAIAHAKGASDIVIVAFHAGTEYDPIYNAAQERVYHAAVDAGANLVIGTHPHVVQDVERYHGAWIAYSLGNFIFDQNWSEPTRHGLMLRATVHDKAIVDIERIPIEISKQYQAIAR